jgi:acetolactate synthase-1/2/3 large subunit
MHLNDAFGRNSGIKKVYCHHEQSCAMATESYFRVSNRMAAVNVTA